MAALWRFPSRLLLRDVVHRGTTVTPSSSYIEAAFDLQQRRGFLSSFLGGKASSSDKKTSADDEKPRVDVSVDADSGICHVRLNRPDKLNALDMPMFEALGAVADELLHDKNNNKNIRAVVLSGQGRAFCTGLDVQSVVMRSKSPNANMERLLKRPYHHHQDAAAVDNDISSSICNLAQHVCLQWRTLPVPVICALHGMAFGGGLQIALGADIRLATPDCKFSIMEGKWGLIPDMGMSVVLRELVRIDVAKELTFTGRVINGQEAAELGLVTRCVVDPVEKAVELAKQMAERSPDAIACAKQLYQQTFRQTSVEESLLVETDLQRQLLKTWNQMAASGRSLGFRRIPYWKRKLQRLQQETATTTTTATPDEEQEEDPNHKGSS